MARMRQLAPEIRLFNLKGLMPLRRSEAWRALLKVCGKRGRQKKRLSAKEVLWAGPSLARPKACSSATR